MEVRQAINLFVALTDGLRYVTDMPLKGTYDFPKEKFGMLTIKQAAQE